MNILNLDNLIVIAYLLVTLVVGIYKGRNIKTFKEYAIGDYKFSNSALVATITATWLSAGSAIGTHEKVYQFGIVWVVIFLFGVVGIFLFQLLAPRIYKFKGHLSVSEIIGTWYGPQARVIGGICVALHSIGMVAAQVGAIGYVCHEFFDLSPMIGILIGAGIVVIYSSFGGIKAVTYTDIIQFAFFMVAIPLIANIMLIKAGGYSGLLEKVPAEHLKIFPNYGSVSEYLFLFLFFAIPFFDSCLIQRVLMAKDKEQVVTSFKSTALVMILFYVLCGLIALSVRTINADLNPNNVLYYTINNYLPMGIKGLGIAGLLAVVMSTADSYLNTSSIAIIHDVVNPLRKSSLTSRQELLVTKFTAILIGSGAILVAISFKSILQIIIKAWIIWAPIMVVPLYATFLGIKSNSNIFKLSAIAGIATVVIWLIYDIEAKTGIDSMIPSLFANLIAFSSASLYYHKYAPKKLNKPIMPNQLPSYKEARVAKLRLQS
ncbi:sodium:solute symporter family protein [Rickettsiales endosymbiont of Stachyamoeba lipophora]|uniref:sodium:solute symporter family protein n=1 Tax=Rickettsiales endosymbiont of Stachyamoeba lipophora TaxID=2486578 RepID=UPI000F64FE9D|nr:sodium:solute symporter family protein [Rickettsiales endosymbiont of Stachyamoeba lipophora]AZL16164.1 sodium:solute symporter family protein [Rickettsiales endosymbiont of Stachyamoeba lipophora]